MKKIGLNCLLIAIFAIASVFTSCQKDDPYDPGDGGGGGGGITGKIIEDFPASFAKKLFENWDCSEWLKWYYSAQGFGDGIETMHCINTFDCNTEFDINDMYESLYEDGRTTLLSYSSYNQNTKCVTIYFSIYRAIGSGWDYMAIRFYTIDVIK